MTAKGAWVCLGTLLFQISNSAFAMTASDLQTLTCEGKKRATAWLKLFITPIIGTERGPGIRKYANTPRR